MNYLHKNLHMQFIFHKSSYKISQICKNFLYRKTFVKLYRRPPMGTYKVDICGVNTSKLPILKEAEKEELFKKIKAGDMEAREKYIQGNLRLVLSVICRFSNHNENLDDLFQIGCIGLMKSVDNFEPNIGVKFSTYAVPMNVTCHGMYFNEK